MALSYHPDLCFIHIPKTGGNYFEAVLRSKEGFGRPGKLDGYGHGLPRNWNYKKIVTLVRMPHTWIRSVWKHREDGGWPTGYPLDCPWRDFIRMTAKYKSHDFEDFAYDLTLNEKGIVTWLFNSYIVPRAQVYTIENSKTSLRFFGDTSVPIPNRAKNLPEISPDLMMRIYQSERYIYERWYQGWQP